MLRKDIFEDESKISKFKTCNNLIYNLNVGSIFSSLSVSPTEEVSNFLLDDFDSIVSFMNSGIK